MKDIIAIIPARSGSKGVYNKNIMLLSGVPLIAYSILAAKKSTLIDRVIVTTDSEEYAAIAKSYGAEVPFLRPKNISGDKATDNEFLTHAIDWFEKNEGYVPNYLVHLRPTTPLRNPKVIDEALSLFIKSNYSALRSCHKMSESAYKTFEIQDSKLKRTFSSSFEIESANYGRQEYPETYDANGYVDVIRADMIKSKGIIHGDKVKAFITEISYEIDEPSDLDYIEYIMMKKSKYKSLLFS